MGGVAIGLIAARQACQCVSFIPGTVDVAGQAQGLLVKVSGGGEAAGYPAQGACLVECLSLTAQVTQGSVDAEGIVKGLSSGRTQLLCI